MWLDARTHYNISYNLTGGEGGPNPNPQTGATTETTITLDSKTPIKCGYAFQYWCSASNTSNSTACSGTHYDPGASYDLSKGTTLNLYAVWKTTGKDLGNLGTMQSFSCSSKIPSIGGFGIVTDTRDNNTYCVRRLADNQCWMTSNLRLGDSKLTDRTLTSANTDLNNGITSYDLPKSNKSGFKGSDLSAKNIYVVEADYRNEMKIYGGYYNWNVATASTGKSSLINDTAPSSICPKGWRLPTGNSGNDFETLNKSLGGNGDNTGDEYIINPDGPAFFRAGEYSSSNNSASSQGTAGYYWSSSSGGSGLSSAVCLYFGRVSFHMTNIAKLGGRSVRCIAR